MGNIIRTGRFHLRAAVNGVTLSAAIVPDTGALAQQLNVTTGATSPSWEGGAGPRFHVEVRDMSNGREYTPVAPRLIYNGTELNFGTSTEATTNNKATKPSPEEIAQHRAEVQRRHREQPCWVTLSGHSYHESKTCPELDGSMGLIEMTVGEAIDGGYDPCWYCAY